MNLLKYLQEARARLIDDTSFWLGILLLLSGSVYFLVYQQMNTGCCDAEQYWALAKGINAQGFDAFTDEIRTFAYPWLLTWLSRIADLLVTPTIFVVFVFQVLVYLAAVCYAALVCSRSAPRAAKWVYLAGSSNVFIMPFLGMRLTDAIYTSLCIVTVSMVVDMAQSSPEERGRRSALLGLVFMACLAVTTRPAAIWLTPVVAYGIFLMLKDSGQRMKDIVLILVGASPLLIQVLVNVRFYQKVSFLPAIDLGSMQLQWGIEYLKYGTWLGEGSPQNFYPASPFINTVGAEAGLIWYLHHMGDAIKLLSMKFFGAFDWDYVLPYPRFAPYFKWLPSLVSFSVLYWGLVAIVTNLLKARFAALGPRFFGLLVLLSWASVSLLSALELRFTLPLLCFCGYAATIYVSEAIYERHWRKLSFFMHHLGHFYDDCSYGRCTDSWGCGGSVNESLAPLDSL